MVGASGKASVKASSAEAAAGRAQTESLGWVAGRPRELARASAGEAEGTARCFLEGVVFK